MRVKNEDKLKKAEAFIGVQLRVIDIFEQYRETSRNEKGFSFCHFHDEGVPSLAISDEKNVFRCFSCGKKGGVINAYMYLENFHNGRNLSYEQSIDRIINEFNLWESLGFRTIFNTVKDIKEVELRPKHKPKNLEILTLPEMIFDLKQKRDTEAICDFIASLQNKVDMGKIYETGNKGEVSLEELMQQSLGRF